MNGGFFTPKERPGSKAIKSSKSIVDQLAIGRADQTSEGRTGNEAIVDKKRRRRRMKEGEEEDENVWTQKKER